MFMGVNYMKIENDYPKIKKEVNSFLIFRKVCLIIFLISIVTSTIINLSVGGKKWMFYVIGGEVIFYFAFLNKPLIDNTFIKKITILVFIICAYLYVIDLINKTSWSYFVISIISFSILIIQLILFFSEYRLQKKKFMPMFFTAIGSIIFCLLAVINVVKINWPVIVLGSLGMLVILILFIFYRKSIINDLKKYFSLK